jgi:hypothetical protein
LGKQDPLSAVLASFLIYIFAIPWTVFSLFWEYMVVMPWVAHAHNEPTNMGLAFAIVFPIFGLPFVVIGFGMLLHLNFVWRKIYHSAYAITDRRALIMTQERQKRSRFFHYQNGG